MERELNKVVKKYWQCLGDLDIVSKLVAAGDMLVVWGNKIDLKFHLRKKRN